MIEVVPPETNLSNAPCTFRVIDCTRDDDASLDFTAPFSLSASAAGTLRCFVIHFDTVFDLSSRPDGRRTSFSTSHLQPQTHWKQTSLYLKAPIHLAKGDTVKGTIAFSRGIEYKRAYDMTVCFEPPNGGDPVTQMWRME